MKIYCISGLGYNYKIYEKINFANREVVFLDWIEPIKKETIKTYAQRMASSIDETEQPIVLIGHSFGGIVAQEIATFRNIQQLILISSIQSRAEMPFFFKLVSPLRIDKLFRKGGCIRTVKYWGKGHGFETLEEQALFKEMVAAHSNHYLQWALRTLSKWEAVEVPSTTAVYQIHGTKDKTFPFRLLRNPNAVFQEAGHLFLYKQPHLVERILHQLLS